MGLSDFAKGWTEVDEIGVALWFDCLLLWQKGCQVSGGDVSWLLQKLIVTKVDGCEG